MDDAAVAVAVAVGVAVSVAAAAAAGVGAAGLAAAADGHKSVHVGADIDKGSGAEAGTEDEAASEAGTGIDNGTDTADTSDTARVGNAALPEVEEADGMKRAAPAAAASRPVARRLHHGFSFRAKRQTLHWCPLRGTRGRLVCRQSLPDPRRLTDPNRSLSRFNQSNSRIKQKTAIRLHCEWLFT